MKMDSLQFQVEVAGQDAVTNNLVPATRFFDENR